MEHQRQRQHARVRFLPAESKVRLGAGGDRRAPGRFNQRQLRSSLRARPSLPESVLQARRASSPAAGPPAPSSPSKPASLSRLSSVITLPATVTRAIRSVPVGTRTSPATSIRTRSASGSTPTPSSAHGHIPNARRQHHLRNLRQCEARLARRARAQESGFLRGQRHAHHREARPAISR